MIIEKGAEIKVLRNFYNNTFDYLSIAEISKRTELSRNWTYQIINKFESYEFLEKSGKKYKLDFSNLFCKRLKLLFDSEHLIALNQELKTRIFSILNKIIFEINPVGVILVGSAALNKQKEGSDIDFLVIGSKKEIPYFEESNIILLSTDELKEKYLKGDDFIISSLLFGKIIYDNNFFINFFENPLPIFSQELIQEKIKYCEILKERIYTLLKVDEMKAREELLYLALQASRLILLKNRIVPRTKHDIADQVKSFNEKIAAIVKHLLKKKKLSKENMLEYIRTCMGVVM